MLESSLWALGIKGLWWFRLQGVEEIPETPISLN